MIRTTQVRPHRDIRVMAKETLAAMLAVLLLVAATLSANHSRHQAVHGDGAAASHACLICSLSKGQVTASDIAPVLLAYCAILIFIAPLIPQAPSAQSDLRLAPGRAPPAR